MTLESIIRPFVSREPLRSQRIIPSGTKKDAETAGATWGKAGTLPTPIESAADKPDPGINIRVQTAKVTDKNVEKSRVTEKVKIEQEGNPDNFVVVDRVKSISFDKIKPPTLQGSKDVTTGYTAFPSTATTTTPATQESLQINKSEFSLKQPPP